MYRPAAYVAYWTKLCRSKKGERNKQKSEEYFLKIRYTKVWCEDKDK
jgi:hypothetical protein